MFQGTTWQGPSLPWAGSHGTYNKWLDAGDPSFTPNPDTNHIQHGGCTPLRVASPLWAGAAGPREREQPDLTSPFLSRAQSVCPGAGSWWAICAELQGRPASSSNGLLCPASIPKSKGPIITKQIKNTDILRKRSQKEGEMFYTLIPLTALSLLSKQGTYYFHCVLGLFQPSHELP